MSSLSRVLKESWSALEADQDRIAAYFYARLFIARPGLRELFPIQMRSQRSRLMGAIVHAIERADDPDDAYFRRLGAAHRRFDVSPEDHAVFRDCLIEAIRVHSPDWDTERETAWRDGYDDMARRMNAGAQDAGDVPPYFFAEVTGHDRRGADIAVFTCKPFPQPVTFRPGQFVYLDTTYEPRQWRPYSIANAPREDGTLEFHVRALGAGTVSTALVWKLKVGDVLRMSAPDGTLRLLSPPTRDVVCVAGGTGLAPVRSLVEGLSHATRTPWVHLFFGVRRADDLYDLPVLETLANRHPWLRLVPAVSDEPDYPGERGMLPDVVARHGPWQDHDFVLSGPPGMIRAMVGRLAELQVPGARVHYDTLPGS